MYEIEPLTAQKMKMTTVLNTSLSVRYSLGELLMEVYKESLDSHFFSMDPLMLELRYTHEGWAGSWEWYV